MLIEPPHQMSPEKPKRHINGQILLHWVLMIVIWGSLLINAKILFDISSGKLTAPTNVSGLNASIAYTLSLFFIVYAVGMTLFLIAFLGLNKFKKSYYLFFIRINSLFLAAFIVLLIFVLITF